MGRKRVKPEDRMVLASGKRKGRPPKFDIPDIEIFADELDEWVEHDENYILSKFCSNRYLFIEELSTFADCSPRFAQSLKRAKQILAARREDMLNAGTMHQSVYNRNQALYDRHLHKHEREEKEYEIDLKRKLIENTGAQVNITCLDYSK
jgi:hypothetical protein